jgi:hypothetical protein
VELEAVMKDILGAAALFLESALKHGPLPGTPWNYGAEKMVLDLRAAAHRIEAEALSVQPDGSLKDNSEYLRWHVGDRSATLDGEFASDRLRAIADHMDRLNATTIHNGSEETA